MSLSFLVCRARRGQCPRRFPVPRPFLPIFSHIRNTPAAVPLAACRPHTPRAAGLWPRSGKSSLCLVSSCSREWRAPGAARGWGPARAVPWALLAPRPAQQGRSRVPACGTAVSVDQSPAEAPALSPCSDFPPVRISSTGSLKPKLNVKLHLRSYLSVEMKLWKPLLESY